MPGRDSAWRMTSLLGALDEIRHTQIPLLVFHDLVRWDPQFDWTHRLFHTNNWVAIAGRHLVDELLLCTDPIEFAVGTHFVFETGFTNLQFVGLSASARASGDRMFEKMLQSIQTDEARHAQVGGAVLRILCQHDPARAQRYVDKWLWRTWHFFAVVTGFADAYFTYTVVKGLGVPWETALGAVFISGAAFLVLTLVGVRQLIIAAIPYGFLMFRP